jgi:hypothetical protein
VRGKALVRIVKRGLRIEAGVARRCDDVEEELAEEVLIVDVEREVEARRLDLHARGALEHPLRGEERRELARDTSEKRLLLPIALLVPLDLLPLREQIAADDLFPREDVRVPANELLVEPARDLVRVERTLLAPELGVDRYLEQKVAELVAEARGIVRIERGERLVRLFQQVRPERRVRLLAVPRASIRRAQALGDAHDGVERREVGERLEWREDEKARGSDVALGVGERRRPIRIEERDRVSDGVTPAEQRPVDGRVKSDRDGPERRERVAIEAARWNDVDAGGPAREDGGERRRATRTRGRG